MKTTAMTSNPKPIKVLVTGAGGFIGSHLGKFLKAKGLLGARRGHQKARLHDRRRN